MLVRTICRYYLTLVWVLVHYLRGPRLVSVAVARFSPLCLLYAPFTDGPR